MENVFKNQIVAFMENVLSIYVSSYRKGHSMQHILVRLIEEWRKGLDDGYIVDPVLMDLSKAYGCERSALKYII